MEKFALNRKHEMFLNREERLDLKGNFYLNRKHEMFLNTRTKETVELNGGLTVNMKCF